MEEKFAGRIFEEGTRVSRRGLLIGAGKVAAGAAIVTAGGLSLISDAEAKKAKYWPYKKLDIDEVGAIAYETYFTKFCSQTVATSIFGPLRKKVGEPYTIVPLDAFFWAHGGIQGWGTACGTLIAAGFVANLIAGEKDGGNIINDVVYFYSDNDLPMYKPAKALKAHIRNRSTSNTPLCHVSVGKWMKKEGVGFFTAERKERCARLSADIAMETARLLNAWADGKYKPKHKLLVNAKQFGITSQTNCTDCHGSKIPDLPGK